MRPYTSAERGYLQNVSSTRSERRTEYEVIARVTQRLREAALKASQNFPAYAAALEDNRTLWQTLALDVADVNNALPAPLRARIFYLYEFTTAHTRKILRDTKISVRPLLEINVAVMRGLKNDGPAR